MKVTLKNTIQGVVLSVGDKEPVPLTPSPDADQEHPRGNYVYAHVDEAEQIFYIGKGTGRRAWSQDRHPVWCRYVEKHLLGRYRVQILQDNLSEAKSEEVEAEWMLQCGDHIVNWQNTGRKFDYAALDRCHRLRDANRARIAEAKNVEKENLGRAAEMYIQAIAAIAEYDFLECESGLVAQLQREEAEELGRCGEIEALDRLTMCLAKLKRFDEAQKHVDSYFALYRRDKERAAFARITKRINPERSRPKSEC